MSGDDLLLIKNMKRKFSGPMMSYKKFAGAPKRGLPVELRQRIFSNYRSGLNNRMARPIARASSVIGRRGVGGLIRRGGRLAASAGAYLAGNVPAAAIGGVVAGGIHATRMAQRAIYNKYIFRKGVQQKSDQKKVSKAYSGMSTGSYSGKFKKVSRKVGPYQKKKEVSQALGFVINKEIYGKIADPDCVYLGHSTYDLDTIAFCITSALLRKLFKIAGYNVTSGDEAMSLESYTAGSGSSAGFTLVWTIERGDGTVDTFTYNLVTGSTLNSVVSSSGLATKITQMMENAGGSRPDLGTFENLWLYRNTGERFLVAHIALKNEIVSIWAKSTLTIQNRTKSADSGSSETNQIDSVPCKGLRYKFRGAVMHSKQQDNIHLSRMIRNGLLLHRASELNPSSVFKEPPAAKEWNNCIGSSYERLDPGSIKKGTVFFQKSGYLNSLLSSMAGKMGSTGTDVVYAPGSSELYALEEVVNTGSSNNLTLQYEREFTTGCITRKGKLPICLASFSDQNINNLPA